MLEISNTIYSHLNIGSTMQVKYHASEGAVHWYFKSSFKFNEINLLIFASLIFTAFVILYINSNSKLFHAQHGGLNNMIFDGGRGGKTDGFISKHTHVYILLILLLDRSWRLPNSLSWSSSKEHYKRFVTDQFTGRIELQFPLFKEWRKEEWKTDIQESYLLYREKF